MNRCESLNSNARFFLIIGPEQSGKTRLAQEIASQMCIVHCVERAFILKGSSSTSRKYSLPNTQVVQSSSLNPSILEQIIELRHDTSYSVSAKPILLVIDDCFSCCSDFMYHDAFKTILLNLRMLNILLVWTHSFPMILKNDVIGQIDYLFLFKETMSVNNTRIYEQYFKKIITKEKYDQLNKCLTKNNALSVHYGNILSGEDGIEDGAQLYALNTSSK